MTNTKRIDLNAEHAACLADRALIERARLALPILKSRLVRASAEVTDFAAMVWKQSGGRDAYGNPIGLQGDIATLERLIARAAPDSWHGWVRRREVDRILARAEEFGP